MKAEIVERLFGFERVRTCGRRQVSCRGYCFGGKAGQLGARRRRGKIISMMLIFAYSITSTVSPGQAALSAGELDFTASSVTPAMTVREVELDPVEEGRLIAGAYDWRRLEFVFLQRRGIRTDLVSIQPSGAESRREAAPGASAGITYDFERARYVVLDSEGDGFAVFDPTAGAFDLSFEQTESLFSEAESGKSSNGEVTGGPFLEPGTALLDVDPYSGDLYVLSTDTSTISVYSPSGRLKDQQTVMVDDPIDFFVAPTSDTTDEPEDTTVFVLGDSTEGTTLFEAIGQRELQESAQAITSVSGAVELLHRLVRSQSGPDGLAARSGRDGTHDRRLRSERDLLSLARLERVHLDLYRCAR